LKKFAVTQIESNGGLLPFPINSHQGSARLDHLFNDTNQASLRYIAAHLEQTDPTGHALAGFSTGYAQQQWTSSMEVSWLHTFNVTMFNEVRAQWNINQYNLVPNDAGGPAIALGTFGSIGRSVTLPSTSKERDYEFADNLTKVHKHHTFQMGVDEILRGNKISNASFLGGDFIFGNLPGGILSPCLQVPAACGITAPSASINALQSLGLGLPQAFGMGGGNATVTTMMPWTSMYFQDDWALRSNLSLHLGMRYEVDQRSIINTTHKDFGPRASFAVAAPDHGL
jgi:hypothetical protein